MNTCDNLQTIGQRMRAAEQRYGRPTGSVQLLAVSKRHPASAIEAAASCNIPELPAQTAFGENYVQEMLDKATYFDQQSTALEWHFIGPIQSNKTKHIAQTAHWVHSVDRFKIAQRLNDQKPEAAAPINVCLQVNVSAEPSKSGLTPDELPAVAEKIVALPNVHLRGLMAIPAPETDFDKQRASFATLRCLQDDLIERGLNLDTLSMGMTGDMEAAIAEGATIIRIGTAIFGQRPV